MNQPMQTKVIVWNDPDTGVAAVTHLLKESIQEVTVVISEAVPATEESEAIAEITAVVRKAVPVDINKEAIKVVPNGVAFQIIDRDIVPSDREYRDAWEVDGVEIKGSVEKAKNIALALMRRVRDENLLLLDREEQAAARGGGGNVAEIQSRKDIQLAITDGVKAFIGDDTLMPLDKLAADLAPLIVVPAV